MDKLFDVVWSAFKDSPSLGLALLAGLWLLGCWWFRYVTLGPKTPIVEALLSAKARTLPKPGTELSALLPCEVDVGESRDDWSVGEVLFLCWTLRVTGWVVLGSTVIAAFSVFAILLMWIASPAEGISLVKVLSGVGWFFLGSMLLLFVLSCMKIHGSIHKFPSSALGSIESWKLIFLSW